MRIGWIGTGVMGSSMCGHLIDAGHDLWVFNRTRERADGVVAKGATWCDSPADVAGAVEVVCTMLGYPDDVRNVVTGDGGVLAAMEPGELFIDLTTSQPSLAVEIAAAADARGIGALDAPVSGGDIGARNGTLVVMVGGSDEAFARGKPVLDAFAAKVAHHGGPGSGQHTKMANQIAISAGMIAVCEALLYASRSGLDPAAVIDTIGGGAAGSWSLTNYGPRMLAGDWKPGFRIEHFVKDLGIALEEARRMGLELRGLELANELYVKAIDEGYGQSGTQTLVKVLAGMSGVEWP